MSKGKEKMFSGETQYAGLPKLHSPEWNAMLAGLVENIPAGVCTVLLDDVFALLYGNESFFAIYGYTPAQMKDELSGQLAKTIHPDDLAYVEQTIELAYSEKKPGFGVEHRVIRRDKTLMWILVNGNFSEQGGRALANCDMLPKE